MSETNRKRLGRWEEAPSDLVYKGPTDFAPEFVVIDRERVLYACMTNEAAVGFIDAQGAGILCQTICGHVEPPILPVIDTPPKEEDKSPRDRRIEKANPLAGKLTMRYCGVLEDLDDIGGYVLDGLFDIDTDNGLANGWKSEPSSNRDCRNAEINIRPQTFQMSGTPHEVARNAAATLRDTAKKLLEAAAIIQKRMRQKGETRISDSPVIGFCVATDADGERLTEVFKTCDEADDACYDFDHETTGVHAVLKDGTVRQFFPYEREFSNSLPKFAGTYAVVDGEETLLESTRSAECSLWILENKRGRIERRPHPVQPEKRNPQSVA